MKPSMGKLSANEKEKTKMRERTRRSITTKIFQGLRKYGGYNLAPRADINEVLRCLAVEAGWTVEEDGTTYRSTAVQAPCQAFRQLSGGRASFSGGSLSGISGLMRSESDGGSLSGGGASMLGVAAGGGALMSGAGVLNSTTNMGGLLSVGNGMYNLQAWDHHAGSYLDARGGGDCSTTASPCHQATAATNSSSLFSAQQYPTTATPPTSSMSLICNMPSASPFASPASSEVYPSSSRSTTTLAAPFRPQLPSTQAAAQLCPSTFPISCYAESYSYNIPSVVAGSGDAEPSPPSCTVKDELVDALPLDYCQHQTQLLAAATLAARDGPQQQFRGVLQEQANYDQRPSSTIFNTASTRVNPSFPALQMMLISQQEARASNHNTPLGSPQHQYG